MMSAPALFFNLGEKTAWKKTSDITVSSMIEQVERSIKKQINFNLPIQDNTIIVVRKMSDYSAALK